MKDIGFYNYENVPIAEKIGWLTNALGRGAVEESRVGLGSLGTDFVGSDMSMRDTFTQLGLGWAGQAADNAAHSLSRAADRGGAVGSASSTGSGNVDEYGLSFEELRQKFQLKDPGTLDTWGEAKDAVGNAFDGWLRDYAQSDYSKTMEANRNLEGAANTALRNHEYSSRFAVQGFPAVDPDAPLTTGGPGGGGAGGPGGGGAGGPGGTGAGVGHYTSPAADLGADRAPASTRTAGATAPPMASGGAPGFGPMGGPGAGGAPTPGLGTGGGAGGAGLGHAPPGIAPGSWSGPIGGVGTTAGIGGAGALGAPGSGGWGSGNPGAYGGSTGGWGSAAGRSGGYNPGGSGARGGAEFGGRLGSGATESPGQRPNGSTSAGGAGRSAGATGHGAPMMGGMGAGAGGGAGEHRRKYWIPSSEHFDSGLPPHTDPVIGGSAEWL